MTEPTEWTLGRWLPNDRVLLFGVGSQFFRFRRELACNFDQFRRLLDRFVELDRRPMTLAEIQAGIDGVPLPQGGFEW